MRRGQGKLPHELSLDQNNVGVVEMLGEPHNKGGSNVPVWIEVIPLLTILIDLVGLDLQCS